MPDSFANFINFVDFVRFSKTHYEKWGAVANRKFEDWEEKEKERTDLRLKRGPFP